MPSTTIKTRAKNKPSIHISVMVGKLDGLKAISTNTVTNDFCVKMNSQGDTICKLCYSHGMLKSYRKNMQPALQRNSDALSGRLLDQSELPTILDAFLRINAHGELINAMHLENICRIAEHNPHCNVALWTKRKDIVNKLFKNRDKPTNLILVYSNPKVDNILETIPKHFDKVFNNVSFENHQDRQNCTGQQCKSCLACYKFGGTDIIVEAVKLNGRAIKQHKKGL
jgi:hypothetical protein